MQTMRCCAVLLLATSLPTLLQADSLWDRRDPATAAMFNDYRARHVGDVLTVVIDETTGFDAQEKRALEKDTNANLNFNSAGTTSGTAFTQVLSSFGATLNLQNQTQRQFNGTANSSIDRKFTDRMSFIVIGVLPNGNLIVEGSRQRIISREVRTLKLKGVVRPADIGFNNTLESRFIADLQIIYEGHGPETNFTHQGWGGRLVNKLWPF